jgi:hypothetical protein
MRCDFARKVLFGVLVGEEIVELGDDSSPMRHGLLFLWEQLFDNIGHLTPAFGFFFERLQPCSGDGVILRFTIVFRSAPGTPGPAVLFKPDKRRIDGALVKRSRRPPRPVGACQRCHRRAADPWWQGCAEDHEVESALQDLDGHFHHLAF